MAEKVSTGGVKFFDYNKDYNPKLSKEQKSEIKDAYAKYRERKKKERRTKTITLVIIVLIILAILAAVFLRSS